MGATRLRRRDALADGDGLELGGRLDVLVKVVAAEARLRVAPVARVQLLLLGEGAGEEAAPQRRVGDDAHAELARGGHHRLLQVSRLQTPFHLDGGHREDGVSSLELRRGTFAQADVLDFPFVFQFQKTLHGFFDRCFRVHSMHVIKVDAINTKTFKAFGQLFSYSCWAAVKAKTAWAWHNAKFRGNDELVPAVLLDCFPKERLIRFSSFEVLVNPGSVEEIDANFQRLTDSCQVLFLRILIVCLVERGHTHSTKSLR